MGNNISEFQIRLAMTIIYDTIALTKCNFNFGIITSKISNILGTDLCMQIIKKLSKDNIIKIKKILFLCTNIEITKYGLDEYEKYLRKESPCYFKDTIFVPIF